MTEEELDTIIRLIPLATARQIMVINGQIEIHKHFLKDMDNLEEHRP